MEMGGIPGKGSGRRDLGGYVVVKALMCSMGDSKPGLTGSWIWAWKMPSGCWRPSWESMPMF